MRKKLVKVLALIFILLLFLGSVYNIAIAEVQDVVLSIYPRPKIDVILAKSRTKTDVSNFKSKLTSELTKQNVDTSDIEIQEIQAQTITDVSSFNWVKKESSSVGTITIQSGGKNVNFVGNQTNAGKNVMYIMPTENQEQKFTFDYTIEFGDSFLAAGMLLRAKLSGNTLTGYMLSFNQSGHEYYTTSGNNGALWQFTFDGINSTNMQKSLVAGLNIKNSGKLSISATDMEITISGEAIDTPYTYTIPDSYASKTGNGYGFFSDHYSHDCTQWGSFSLNNINLQTAVVKKFSEVLRVPDWREDAYKILVYVEDTQNEELQSGSAMGELLTRLLNGDIYFVGWGKDKNKEQLQSLITSNNDKGKFINNTTYESSLTETAKYIKELIDKIKSSDYLLVDEPISINFSPPGIDKNTTDDQWQYGRWKVTHDHTYFENDMGQFAESGKYTDAMITSFNKTGKYVITYEDRPITPKEIYVHRRPIAEIGMTRQGNQITLTSNSYDLDQRSKQNGIKSEEWKWKKISDTTWTNDKLTTINPSESYIVQLRVQDFQNEWSAPATRFITQDAAVLPIAMFSLGAEKISKYEKLEITDSSYDPSGGTISTYKWELYKEKQNINIGSESSKKIPSIDFTNRDLGEYTLYLTVTNNKSKTSEKFGRTFTVTKDEIAPEFVATPTDQQDWKQSASIQLEFTDKGGSKFKEYKYAITDNQGTPSNWDETKTESNDTIVITQEGEKYLHVKGYDNDENESLDRVLGPYKVDNSLPTADIRANLETPTTQPITVTINTDDRYSGVKSVMVDTKKLEHTDTNMFTISRNGTYKLKVEDNAGNIYTQDIVVTNINCTCDAGLNHPVYSSTLNSCPICDLIENLEVTNKKVTYNSKEQGITYDGADSSIIVEYYNENKSKPVEAGDYSYDLKVIYNQVEYNTGRTGTFTIEKKKININNITAINRQYNSTTTVNLEGGELVGVEESDKNDVNFVLPKTGSIDNKNIGEHNVTIPEITLTGEKSNNYSLIQPDLEDVSVTISKKDITIENISSIERQYNAGTEVNLTGGRLVGIEEIDKEKVGFTLAETGTIDNKNVGEHNVTVPEIVLTGEEAYNYSLKQPELQEVKVNIIPKEINIINITTINRKYNGLTEIDITGGELVGVEEVDKEKVDFALPKTGTMESKNVGENKVTVPEIVLIGEEAYNYTLIQPKAEEVKATITPKDITIENITAKNREYDGTNIVKIDGGTLIGVEEIDKEKVGFITEENGTTKSKDIGEYDVIIPEIKLNGEEANNYTLIQPEVDAVKVTIEKRKITIEGVRGKDRKYDRTDIVEIEGGKLQNVIEGEDVKAVIPKTGKIQDKEQYGKQVIDIEEIKLEGKDIGNYELIQPEKDSITVTILKANTPSLYIEPSISSINGKDANNKIRYGDEVELTLKIYNKGDGAGFAEKVIDTIPEGLEFIKDNEINKKYGWKEKLNNKVETEILNSDNIENEIKPLQKENTSDKNDTEEKDTTEKQEKNTIIDKNIIDSENTVKDENTTNTEENTEIEESNITEENISSVKAVEENNTEEENITENNITEEENITEDTNTENIIESNIIEENLVETENSITEENVTENTVTEDTTQETGSLYKELKLVLRITESKGKYSVVKNIATLEQVDIKKDKIENNADEKEAILDIKLSYTDLSVENRIKQIIETRPDTQISHPIRNYNLAKIEIHKNDINTSKLEVTYEIVVRNTGWESGNIDKVEFTIPKGMGLLSKNVKVNGNIATIENLGEVKPGETKRKEITLQANARDLLGTSESKAKVLSEEDIDQRKIAKENNGKINGQENKIEKTNNTDKSDLMVAIKTGRDINNFINLLAIISLTITGTVAYVVFRRKTIL